MVIQVFFLQRTNSLTQFSVDSRSSRGHIPNCAQKWVICGILFPRYSHDNHTIQRICTMGFYLKKYYVYGICICLQPYQKSHQQIPYIKPINSALCFWWISLSFFSEFSFFNQGNLPNHSPMAPWPSCTPPVGSCHPRSCPRSRPGSSSPHAPRRRGRAGSGRPGRPVCSCWPWSLGIPSIIHPGGWIDMNGILMDMNGWGYI